MVDLTWPIVEPLLQRGIDRVTSTQTTKAIREAVDGGRYRLWAIYHRIRPLPLYAAMATLAVETNKGLTAIIDTIGGDRMDEWLDPALERFCELAKANGAVRVEVTGRLGWQRVLNGFKPVRVTLERALTDV